MEASKEEEVRNEELTAAAEQERAPTERELRIAAFLARDEEEEAERNREHRLKVLNKIRGRVDPELQRAAEAVERERRRLQDQKQAPWQNVESLLLKKQSCVSGGVAVAVRAVKPTSNNQRGKLKAQLRSKTIQSGTRWLAKELGYKNENEYMHSLKLNEIARKETALKKLQMERQRQVEFSPLSSPSAPDSPASPARSSSSSSSSALSPQLEPAQSPERLADQLDAEEDEETVPSDAEETEDDADEPNDDGRVAEMAVADENAHDNGNGSSTESDHSSEAGDAAGPDDDDEQDDGDKASGDAEPSEQRMMPPSQVETEIDTQTQSQDVDVPAMSDEPDHDGEPATQGEVATQSTEIDENDEEGGDDATRAAGEKEKTQQAKDRAAEYRRMLELDYREARRSKSASGGGTGILEDEAEEEEEEVLKGLGDFGFGVPKSSEGADEDEAKLTRITEDDLKHIVDDVSDGEGDEEEAEEFRRAAVEAEERDALKRVVERVREGYDKDRTVRGAVRGKFGLNELTAAGNKGEARRLNLLTQDELESDLEDGEDKEKNQVPDEEDDYEEALTKALVDRHLRKPEYDAFASESEDESEAEAGPEEGVEETEEQKAAREEEQRQKLREKLFKLRARMRRVLSKQKNATTTIGFSSETTQLGPMPLMDEGSQSVMFAEESRTIMNLVDLTNRGTTRKSNTLYQGVIDQEQLDAGYGMGMAVSKKQKSHSTSEGSSASATATAAAAASSASSSNGSSKGLFADVTAAAAPQALKRRLTGDAPMLQRQASFATVAKRQCMNRSKTTHSFSGAARGGIGQQFVFMSENSMPAPVDSNTNDASRDASLVRSASLHQRQAKPVTTIGFGPQSKPVTTIGFDLPSQSPSLLSIALTGRSKSQKQQRSRTALKPKNA